MIIRINEAQNKKYVTLLNITDIKNIQWEYRDQNEWKAFNLFMNSQIEYTYIQYTKNGTKDSKV